MFNSTSHSTRAMQNQNRIKQLDLNLLKVFRSLYEEQNMSRTAEALHLTPSAISHAVRRLRDALGDPLFQRAQNRMVPTPACRRLAPQIIENLANLQRALQQWDKFDPQTSNHLFRIGIHDSIEISILPALCSTLGERAPGVGFASVKFDRTQLARELSAGHIDVALDVGIRVKKVVRHQELWTSNLCVLMRKGHPLCGKLNKKNYLTSQHISVSNRPIGMTMEDAFFQKAGLERESNIRCQNYLAASKVLINSDQLLTTTKKMAKELLNEGLYIEDIPFDIKPYSMQLYWHEHSDEDAALSWLRETIIEVATIGIPST